MNTYIIEAEHSFSDNGLQTVRIEATSREEAERLFAERCPGWFVLNIELDDDT